MEMGSSGGVRSSGKLGVVGSGEWWVRLNCGLWGVGFFKNQGSL